MVTWPWLVLAIAGLVVTGTLLVAGGGDELPFCGEGSGCDLVQASAWSTLLGVPLSGWGLLTYLALLGVALGLRQSATRRRWLNRIAVFGFVVSVYLTAISAFVIEAFCTWCLVSAGLMTAAFVLSLLPGNRGAENGGRLAGAIAGVVAAGMMHTLASGVVGGGAVDPELRALAEHLDARGVRFYGASWCPHCQEQKDVFGAAAKYLPYVECSPNGRNGPPATECVVKEIRRFPTWIIDGRKVERLLTPPALMQLTAFAPDTAAADPAVGD